MNIQNELKTLDNAIRLMDYPERFAQSIIKAVELFYYAECNNKGTNDMNHGCGPDERHWMQLERLRTKLPIFCQEYQLNQ